MAGAVDKTPKKIKTYGRKTAKKWYDRISPIKKKPSPSKDPENAAFTAEPSNGVLLTPIRVLRARSTNPTARRSHSRDYDKPLIPMPEPNQLNSKAVTSEVEVQPKRVVPVRKLRAKLSESPPLVSYKSDKPVRFSKPNISGPEERSKKASRRKLTVKGSLTNLPALIENMTITEGANVPSMKFGPGSAIIGKTASGRSIGLWDGGNVMHNHVLEPAQDNPSKALATKRLPMRGGGYSAYDKEIAQLCQLCTLPENRFGTIGFQEWTDHFHISVKKLTEGSYGEVYRGFSSNNATASIFKLIALRPYRMPNGSKIKKQDMTAADALITEVQIMEAVGGIPGFVDYRGLYVVQGRMSRQFADQWEIYHEEKGAKESDKPNPTDPNTHTSEQLWAVIEMEEAGSMLPRFQLRNWAEAWDIFWGITIALARAETVAQFEHRDLHRGNVCVERLREPIPNTYGILPAVLGQTGVKTTIIDFTLSRCLANADTGNEVAFVDLNKDPFMFSMNRPDENISYQNEVYRFMRDSISRENGGRIDGIWEKYHPKTNVYWLHYIADTLHTDLAKKTDGKWMSEGEKWFRHRLVSIDRALDPRDHEAQRPEYHFVLRADVPLKSATEVVEMGIRNFWISHGDLDVEGDSSTSN